MLGNVKQIENIVNWICIIIHPSLLLIIIVVLFIIDSDSFSLLHLTTTYWPIILIWLLFAFLSTKLEEINKQPVKKHIVGQIKNNSIYGSFKSKDNSSAILVVITQL